MTEKLNELRKTNPEMDQVLTAFEQADQVYQKAMEAMGASSQPKINVQNSQNFTLAFKPVSSTFSFNQKKG